MRKYLVAAGWAWAAAIVWLSLTPVPPKVDVEMGDKLGHLAAYGLLMLWFASLYRTRVYFAAGFAAMGIALEFVQGWTGYRSLELADMAANTLGVGLGWGAAVLVRKMI